MPRKQGTNFSNSTPPVFFIVGCQRSGSNWLRTMLGEREDLFAPHPPHIMRDFLPNLSKFGNLDGDVDSLKVNENALQDQGRNRAAEMQLSYPTNEI